MSELVWPFRQKDTRQYQRVDQGWDLQGLGPGEEDVLAVRDGTVTYARDPGSDGAHFGDPYPVLTFDASVDAQSTAVYYGHTHPAVPSGAHVHQGDLIARTSSPGGGGAPNHWLEIGWWGGNGPIGNGSKMRWYLERAPVFGQAPPPPPPPPPTTTQTGDAEVASVANVTINTDGNGNGYNDLPAVPFAKVIGLFTNGADPATSHVYSPIPRLAALDEEGHCRVVLEGGPPSGAVLVHVAVAA